MVIFSCVARSRSPALRMSSAVGSNAFPSRLGFFFFAIVQLLYQLIGDCVRQRRGVRIQPRFRDIADGFQPVAAILPRSRLANPNPKAYWWNRRSIHDNRRSGLFPAGLRVEAGIGNPLAPGSG